MSSFFQYCPGIAKRPIPSLRKTALVTACLICTIDGFRVRASDQPLPSHPEVADVCRSSPLRRLAGLFLTLNPLVAAYHPSSSGVRVHTCASSITRAKLDPAMAVVPLPAATPAVSLKGVSLPRVSDGEQVDLGAALASSTGKTMLVLGTYPADFNMIEVAQRVRAFWSQLQEKGIDRCMMVVNGNASACSMLAELLDLPEKIELFPDPTGEAGRRFGVSRGWRPDDEGMNPYLKLTAMGIGIGPPWMTLPAVLTGYFGNPNGRREWIEETLKQGQLAGRWPAVLELAEDGSLIKNKFDDFPLLGSWGRRPLELATLRLQNLVSIQAKHWDALKPADDRCLTQLGGCTVVGPGGEPVYSWVDEGLCDIPCMYQLLEAL